MKSASLRWRMTLAFGLLGSVLGGLFAGATIFITEYYEQVLLDGMLGSFAADIGERHAKQNDQSLRLPQDQTLRGFLRRAEGGGFVPEWYASLPLGFHEVDLSDDHDVRVGVFELGKDRLFLAIDLADVEPLEAGLELILAAIIVFGTMIGAWFGWFFSGRTIAPVRRLAEAVDALPTRAQSTHLALHAADDEVGRLASAIDGYQERLMRAEARERAFFADASHELRTPLAVVRGSTELLLDDSQLGEPTRRHLERLERGVQTLSDLLEVLLGLARGTTSPAELVKVKDWMDLALAGIHAAGRIELHVGADAGSLVLRPREAGLLVRGIVRRLDRSRSSGKIEIHVDRSSLTFITTRQPGSDLSVDVQEVGDSGLGATLVGRLAAHMEWVIDESCLSAGRIVIRLPMSAMPRA